MKHLMKKSTAGSALVEVVIAITILGMVSAPICSGLLMAARINFASRDLLKAQMQVSSAVEHLMAAGIEQGLIEEAVAGAVLPIDLGGVDVVLREKEEFSVGITVNSEAKKASEDPLVSVDTFVKVVEERQSASDEMSGESGGDEP